MAMLLEDEIRIRFWINWTYVWYDSDHNDGGDYIDNSDNNNVHWDGEVCL